MIPSSISPLQTALLEMCTLTHHHITSPRTLLSVPLIIRRPIHLTIPVPKPEQKQVQMMLVAEKEVEVVVLWW